MEYSIISNEQEAEGLYTLVLEPRMDAPVFTLPGQFVEIHTSAGEAFFALASAPGEYPQLLVKPDSDVSRIVSSSVPSQKIEVRGPLGNGLPVHLAKGKHLHLFSMGSGLSVFRSLIRFNGDDHRLEAKSITLWHGSFTSKHVPYHKEIAQWISSGVSVNLCLDEDPSENTGNVVNRIRDLNPVFENVVAFWIGSKGFGESLKEVLNEKDVSDSKIHTNH